MKPEWFAGRLRQLRAKAGLTQQELAARVPGMALRTVTYLESGDRLPQWDTVLALCGALGCWPNDFAIDPGEVELKGRGRPKKNQGDT